MNPDDRRLLRAIAAGLAIASLILVALIARHIDAIRAAGSASVTTAVIAAAGLAVGFLLVVGVVWCKPRQESPYRGIAFGLCVSLCTVAAVALVISLNYDRSAMSTLATLPSPRLPTLAAWATATMLTALICVARTLTRAAPPSPDEATAIEFQAGTVAQRHRLTVIVIAIVAVAASGAGVAVSNSARDGLIGFHSISKDDLPAPVPLTGNLQVAYSLDAQTDNIVAGGPGFLVVDDETVYAYNGETNERAWEFSFASSLNPRTTAGAIHIVGSGSDTVVFFSWAGMTVALHGPT